jgi:hypothetical protein
VTPSQTATDEKVEFTFRVRFVVDLKRTLFEESRTGAFVNTAGTGSYALDAKLSGLSEADISSFFSDDLDEDGPPTPEHFVRFGLRQLMNIARGPNDWKKAWLREYLGKVNDTPEKRQLLRALAAQR